MTKKVEFINVDTALTAPLGSIIKRFIVNSWGKELKQNIFTQAVVFKRLLVY